ncbi:FG-GAP-like repeat-containing protein [uncultured Dokdonia sp.]|uniref:FG-GAP-like repeat-containing protein n=1 Tax=uncultured Dokdonia sp. TaxID=575653 RepID=UPI00261F6B75|nr:FG-GAP-like repeat-containing protein [uncultured Dokdonia sp.]
MKRLLLFLILSVQYLFGQVEFRNDESVLFDQETIYGTSVLGPSISFFDFDKDGWDDITMPASAINDFQFFKNVNGNFQAIDLGITSNNIQARNAIWVDIDNDGDNDFFATSDLGYLWLYRNEGNNIFTNVTSSSGLPDTDTNIPYWGSSWGDYNNDGFLDLFISVRDFDQEYGNLLFRNNGNGTFIDVTESAGIPLQGQISFCSAFFDYNNDGHQDIYIANDKEISPNSLYRNNGNGTFTDVSLVSGTNLIMSAMSTTIDDYNNDGWLDIYVTNLFPPFFEDATAGNAFLVNNGDGTFTNIALENGTRFESIGWGAVFLDALNNSHKDLYVSASASGETGILSSALYLNDGQGIYSISTNTGIEDDQFISYSNAIGDIQNDGLQDIVVINANNEPISLWNNTSTTDNNWLKVTLEGTTSNKMGIGSKIKVGVGDHVYYGYTLCGEGYMNQNSNAEFFGLGDATTVDYIEVTWLSGMIDHIENIDSNQTINIIEGSHPLRLDEFTINDITLYPNPATNAIHFTHPENQQEIAISIIDIQGKVIKKQHFDSTIQEQTINISDIASGIYFISIDDTQKTVIKKIVIL